MHHNGHMGKKNYFRLMVEIDSKSLVSWKSFTHEV